jgi:hypothetical protein
MGEAGGGYKMGEVDARAAGEFQPANYFRTDRGVRSVWSRSIRMFSLGHVFFQPLKKMGHACLGDMLGTFFFVCRKPITNN